jgi:hypothetical protein
MMLRRLLRCFTVVCALENLDILGHFAWLPQRTIRQEFNTSTPLQASVQHGKTRTE